MITQPLKIAPCHGQNVVKSQPVTWQRVPLWHGYLTEKKKKPKVLLSFKLCFSSFSNDGELRNGKHYSNAKISQKNEMSLTGMKSVTTKTKTELSWSLIVSNCQRGHQ